MAEEGNNGTLFESNERGNFRIWHQGLHSDWTPYQHIAVLQIGDRQYVGVTDYYAGTLPTETVMELVQIDTPTATDFV